MSAYEQQVNFWIDAIAPIGDEFVVNQVKFVPLLLADFDSGFLLLWLSAWNPRFVLNDCSEYECSSGWSFRSPTVDPPGYG